MDENLLIDTQRWLSLTQTGAVPASNMDENLLIDTQRWLSLTQTGAVPAPQFHDAWERFYRRYDPFVRAIVAGCSVPPAGFDDSVQDAWLELTRALPNLRLDPSRGSLLAWMRTVVFRTTRDTLRQARTLAMPSHDPETRVETTHDPRTRSPIAECVHREQRTAVRSALRDFRRVSSRVNFRVLYLVSFVGLSAQETADRLDLTVAQVWTRHHRVKRLFRRFLQTSGISG